MRVIDLSQAFAQNMPVYPGTEAPIILEACTIAKDGFAEKFLSFYSHTGTHMDAPSHMIAGAASLDHLAVDRFYGKGLVIDATNCGDGRIEVDRLSLLKAREDGISFILFMTGWDGRWGQPSYFVAFPYLSSEAADTLLTFGFSGIGLDCVSADPVGSVDFPIHTALLGSGMVIVENLRGLAELKDKRFFFSCLPLPIMGADGSPVRAVAILE